MKARAAGTGMKAHAAAKEARAAAGSRMNSCAAFALVVFACLIVLFGCASQQGAEQQPSVGGQQTGGTAQQSTNQTPQQGALLEEFEGADEGLAQSIEDLEQLK